REPTVPSGSLTETREAAKKEDVDTKPADDGERLLLSEVSNVRHDVWFPYACSHCTSPNL
ncbi:unnamed protein product, partial [Eruca vesicaria subsp. sativa]|nr:unnamed protein product [Eruca vesicaria subsp. sativa]